MPLSQYKTLPGESGVQGKHASEQDRENIKFLSLKTLFLSVYLKNRQKSSFLAYFLDFTEGK